jgi:HAD superfamily hydrolase (TIGR01549 family)
MIKAIYFDCFGLFYPDPINKLQADTTLDKHVSAIVEELDNMASKGDISIYEFIVQTSIILGWTQNEVTSYFLTGRDRNIDLVKLVGELRAKYRVGMLSNIGKDMIDGFFANDELEDMFDVCILSADVKLAKPDPKIFLLACERIGAEPNEVIMIDDTPEYLDGAQSIGMHTIHYTNVKSLINDLHSKRISIYSE